MPFRPLALLALLELCRSLTYATQDPEEVLERRLWDENFVQKRPGVAAPTSTPPARVSYKAVAPAKGTNPANASSTSDTEQLLFGITLWRLRDQRSSDGSVPRLFVLEEAEGDQAKGMIPERMSLDDPLEEGQKVFLTFESPRDGYLYVIDRERFADGSLGDPYLIYPQKRIQGGANRVQAGRVVTIPSPQLKQAYFRVRRNRTSADRLQTGEVLSFLLSPKQLEEFPVPEREAKLPNDIAMKWEKWSVQPQEFQLSGGEGKTWTQEESKATMGALLSKSDPLPQTLQVVRIKRGEPALIAVQLVIR